MTWPRLCIIALFVVWGLAEGCGQTLGADTLPPPLPPLDDVHPLQEAIFPFLLPVVFNCVEQMKAMFGEEEYQQIRTQWGDQYAVDLAFRRAMSLCWNNRGVTLLVMFLATIDHRNVGIQLPLLGPLLWLPLSGEFPEEFERRLRALPAHLFPDSPEGEAGDRDKLQHFFGSAFLAYLFGDAEPAERIGDFVEWGEDAFIVGGVNDVRDREANTCGRQFAMRLLEDHEAVPSDAMKKPLAPRDPAQVHQVDKGIPEPLRGTQP